MCPGQSAHYTCPGQSLATCFLVSPLATCVLVSLLATCVLNSLLLHVSSVVCCYMLPGQSAHAHYICPSAHYMCPCQYSHYVSLSVCSLVSRVASCVLITLTHQLLCCMCSCRFLTTRAWLVGSLCLPSSVYSLLMSLVSSQFVSS